MAQLTDDCFAFSGPLLPLAEMERLIAERVTPVAEVEEVALSEARRRVIAADVMAAHDLPPFNNSAVDGYAVRHADLAPSAETRLAIAQRVMAGETAAALPPGAASRIFTGAPLPQGADTVFMQEDCRRDGDAVILPPGLARGANSRLAGEDVPRGAVLLPAGRRLMAPDIALAAALGLTRLAVRRRLRVAVFSTGDEVVEPGVFRPAAAVYDANRHLLRALLEQFGAAVSDLGILRDTPAELQDAIADAAAGHDLVVTSGGVSTGEADHVRNAIESIGRLVFWRVAIKPGRPVAMGVIRGRGGRGGRGWGPGTAAAFAGLPGNPAAVYVTFVRVVRPLLMRLAGAEPRAPLALPVRAGFAYRKRKGRREYIRVSLRRAADGMVEAEKFPRDGAGVITSLTETDGLVELGEEVTEIAPGAMVGFLSHAALTE
jgi:molybdopterin molybdotransferase